jgi:hypothetical protein
MKSVNEWKFNFYSIWLINNNNVVLNNPQMVSQMILQTKMGTQIFYIIIPFAYCSIVNLCFMWMFVDQNKPLNLNQVHSILGESTLKLAKQLVCLQSHFKIWQFCTKTQESRLESFLSFILKTSMPTLNL